METEADKIKKYLINGGNLLLMLEPGVETGLQKIFKDYGVSWRADFIYDESRHLRADKYAIAVTSYPRHKITRDLALTVFPGAVAFEPTVIDDTADIKPVIIPLIETSDKAGSLKTEGLYEKKIIGLSIKSKTNNSNIVLLGDETSQQIHSIALAIMEDFSIFLLMSWRSRQCYTNRTKKLQARCS